MATMTDTDHISPSDPITRIMTRTVATVDPSCTLLDIATELAADEIGAVLVEGPHGAVGLVSERDLAIVLGLGGDVTTTQAGEVMNTDVVWAQPTDSIRAAAQLMHQAGVRHLPVGDGDRVLGMLSIRDLVPVLLGAV